MHSSETLEKQNQEKIELHTAVKSNWIEAVVKMLSESCRIADSASSFKLWKHIAEKKSSYTREREKTPIELKFWSKSLQLKYLVLRLFGISF